MPHTWVTVEISATIRGLRGASLVILTVFSFNISVLAEQKPDGLQRITVDYSTFNQAVKPTMAAFPDMVSALEQIKTALVLGMKLLAWQFFLFSRKIRSNLHLCGRGQSILLMDYIHSPTIIT